MHTFPVNRMNRANLPRVLSRALCSTLLLGLLSACTPVVTVVSDPVFAALYLSNPESGSSPASAFDQAGYTAEYVALENTSPSDAEIGQALSAVPAERPVAVSPLLAREVAEVAADREGRDFLLLGGVPRGVAPAKLSANVSYAVHERSSAFERLGSNMAALLATEPETSTFVVYARTDSEERAAEIAAFRSGLGPAIEQTRFIVFEDAVSEARLREELFRVGSPDVPYVGVFLGKLNRLVYEEVGQDGPGIVTEDLGPGGEWNGLAVYSVERTYAAALDRFLEGERGRITVDARVVDRRERGPAN